MYSESREKCSFMLSIGEFSKAAGLTVKTLRFYHDEGLLIPAFVDPQTGYRYYDPNQLEHARLVAFLRSLEFPIAQIKELLASGGHGEAFLDLLHRQKSSLEQKIEQFQQVIRRIEAHVEHERQAHTMAQTSYAIEEKVIDPLLIAGVRMKGHYSDCAKGFARIGRAMGRHICGPALMLHYDAEYKEGDADFEACMPIKRGDSTAAIAVRQLPGGRCVSLLHLGPYNQLGPSYARILQHVKDKGYRILMPTREIYLKGPGMLFKGNPAKYLTEIQILFET